MVSAFKQSSNCVVFEVDWFDHAISFLYRKGLRIRMCALANLLRYIKIG
jgi:hypothetical protein